MAYSIPKSTAKRIQNIEGFKGVDFTSSPLEVELQRSPNAVNIMNYDGYLQTRKGWKKLKKVGNKINGVWNVDIHKVVNGVEVIEEDFIIHSGTNLYMANTDFSEVVEVIGSYSMSDNISTGLYFGDKLLIFDGTRAIIFGKFDTDYRAKYLDTAGYIPLTSIARDENGGGKSYEAFNMISPYAQNSFLSTETQTQFKLDIVATSVTSVKILNEYGEYEEAQSGSWSYNNGIVTFNVAPGVSHILGRDNILITYMYNNTEEKNKINKCTIATLYGYDGDGNRIFLSGNNDLPNYEFYSNQSDCTYFPDVNYVRVGAEAIKGYLHLTNGKLAILKEHSDTDLSLYYHSYNMYDNVEVFPLKDGVRNLGCLGIRTTDNLLNDPLYLTPIGICAISTSESEAYAKEKSYFINGKLLKEENLDKAFGLAVSGKYYLSVNNHMYIADSRYVAYPKNALTQEYQYEWYYWENIPARILFSWNDKIYFGTEDGYICGFGDDYKDDGTAISAYFETPFLSLGSNLYSKTIKNLTLEYNLNEDTEQEFGYYQDEEGKNVITIAYDRKRMFPKTISEKEKIKKFMFVKFYVKSKPGSSKRICIENLSIEYTIVGRYKSD